MAKKVNQRRNEFRKHKPSGHPAYIYEKVGDEFRFIGITHSKISRGVKNIELDVNPDPDDTEKAYLKRKPEIDKTNKFRERKNGWKFSDKDKDKPQKIIEESKKRSAPRKSKR